MFLSALYYRTVQEAAASQLAPVYQEILRDTHGHTEHHAGQAVRNAGAK
jgi:hypothetical protein